MSISKSQKHIKKICACGCGISFNAFPIYKSKQTKENPQNYDIIHGIRADLYVSKYKRGHNPKTKETQLNGQPPWNKGLKKNDHPSIQRMGFQPGHEPYNDWSHVHDLQRNDPKYRKKWLKSKQGQIAWNKGLKKENYKNGIKSGPDHGNWCGNKGGAVDLAKMKTIKAAVRARDNYTCQHCGDHNHKGRGSRIRLEVHHIIALAENPSLAFVLDNLTTLCHNCHMATDNYGTKVVNKIRKQGGN